MSKFEDGKITELVPAQSFTVKSLNAAKLGATDKKAMDAFCKKVSELQRASSAGNAYLSELSNKLKYFKTAIIDAPDQLSGSTEQLAAIEKRIVDVNTKMNGDATLSRREFETVPSITGRIGTIEGTLWTSSSAPTSTALQSYDVVASQFASVLAEIKSIDAEIKKAEVTLENNKAPYTPGRMPVWENK
ncbi:MAG: glycosyl hydrolase, partial [Bacteroidota bacterium]